MDGTICICGMHMAQGYSGGRYCAWILGEALAAGGASVTLWTTAVPQYARDFEDYPGHNSIRCHVDPGFVDAPRGVFDWVVIIPDRGSANEVYERWLCLALRSRARVALLNFESPNWFNALSGTPVPESSWDGWTYASRFCDVIISLAEESTRFAREFYQQVPVGCRFASCPPAINSWVADSVGALERRKQVCVISRLGGTNFAHKGGYDLVEAIGPEMTGYELVFLVGISAVQEDILAALEARAAEHDVRLRFLNGANDRQKFEEIKRSRLMLFLSRFEGFGYPPVEALYCGTPCIVYDLPILREISGAGLVYVAPGDCSALRGEIGRALAESEPDTAWLRRQVAHVATFESFVARSSLVFAPACDGLPIQRFGLWRRISCSGRPLLQHVGRRLSNVRRRLRGHK